ncbi:MAG: helix-turn-helix domain-containing protein [Oscillospiraceae bacterium]
MKHLQSIELNEHSKEEILPEFASDFPYIATCAELDKYTGPIVPWHWHRTVELFYMGSGTLEYTTPNGKWVFPAGSGGFVNSNVLHITQVVPSYDRTVQLLHLFVPSFLSGEHGSRMESKYILPLTAAPGVEMIPLYPADPIQAEILADIRQAFDLSEQEWGYEFKLREALAHIWLKLFAQVRPMMEQGGISKASDDKIKMLMVYIHEHFQEPISVAQLAQAIHVSKRACFRLFQENLHMTPVEYIRNCRLQKACQMLAKSKEPIAQIAYSCSLGSSSYFGKIFREAFGCSPKEYRKRWHDSDKNGRQ